MPAKPLIPIWASLAREVEWISDQWLREGNLDAGGRLLFASIDEVGRGCIAGPVFAASSLFEILLSPPSVSTGDSAKDSEAMAAALSLAGDSKKISSKKRAEITRLIEGLSAQGQMSVVDSFHGFRQSQIIPLATRNLSTEAVSLSGANAEAINIRLLSCTVGSASSQEIDRYGILPATELAMSRAFEANRVAGGLTGGRELDAGAARGPSLILFVDGNVAPRLSRSVEPLDVSILTVVKGDGLLKSVGLSSVIAKEARDAAMTKAAAQYPGYGLESNMGYGTADHYRGLAALGPSPLHRRSFRLS